MTYETAYNKAIETCNRDIKLLFQRVNFFLIATAFMIAAFTTLLTVGIDSRVVYLDYVLSLAGLGFSMLFATTNYLNTIVIRQIGQYILELESHDFNTPLIKGLEPHQKIDQIVQKSMDRGKIWSLIFEMFVKGIWTLIMNPRESARTNIVSYSYIVPLFFAIVWLALFIFLLVLQLA